jgi:hypothetical protein
MEKSYHFLDVRQDNEITGFPDQAVHLQGRGESRSQPTNSVVPCAGRATPVFVR